MVNRFGLVEEIDSAAESIYSYWFRQMSNVQRPTACPERAGASGSNVKISEKQAACIDILRRNW